MNQITINLSPLLASEVYGRTVETILYDHRGGVEILDDNTLSLCEKIEKNSSKFTVDNLGEAAALYNTLYSLIDFFAEWAQDEGVKWLAVRKAAVARMRTLEACGLTFNNRGWAIEK